MAELAALQAEMAQALLSGRFDQIAMRLSPGPVPAAEALTIHRGTALSGLVNALRISHPTVLALVGGDFFDQAARAFVRYAPPASAWLSGYGEGFAEFLAAYELARGLPYLADVASFDFAVDAVAAASPGEDGASLDLGEALLMLDASLRLIEVDYPADEIRDAVAEDEERLARIDTRPQRRTLALWRLPDGTGVRPLSLISAAFIAGMLAGDGQPALQATQDDLAALQAEVLTAPFARLSLKPTD